MGRLTVRREVRGRKFRVKKAAWIDPFPWIAGTHPEKLLFAALVRRRIYFIFQGELTLGKGGLLQDRNFKPDFIVPEWKIIYDPYGDFAHTQARAIGTREKPGADVWKEVYYRSLGYEFIHPWTSVIERLGADWMIDLSDRLHKPPMFPLTPEDAAWKKRQGYKLGPNVGLGSNSTAIANHLRAKGKPRTIRVNRS